MKLQHVTFTGIDGKTDLWELYKIQEEYPFVEWGVLLSKDWRTNGNRFFNPSYLQTLRESGLNLSAHLCGTMAAYAIRGGWDYVYDCTRWDFDVFKRCQLNVSTRKDNPARLTKLRRPDSLEELIIQQRSADEVDLWRTAKTGRNITVLLDASGGRGIDTPIKVLKNAPKVGYAGGINVDNVFNKLTFLLTHEEVNDFWIDMENGVRTDDWFDTDFVRSVLHNCKVAIEKLGLEKQYFK